MNDRAANNRRLAEWLGWQISPNPDYGVPPDKAVDLLYQRLPDFYTDEAANAMLLEKMPHAYLMKEVSATGDEWMCSCDGEDGTWCTDTDRKTAICSAALALIESSAQADH